MKIRLSSIPFPKKPKNRIFLGLVAIIILLIIQGVRQNDPKPTHSWVEVDYHDLIQEVTVAGRVKPAEQVDLSFDRFGRVSKIFIQIGQKVQPGQSLVMLENGDLYAQTLQAQAGLDAEKAKLAELEFGTQTEELQRYEITVRNAHRSVLDTEEKLKIAKQKAEADLEQTQMNSLHIAHEATLAAKQSLFTLTDLQYAYFNQYDIEDNTLAVAKALAIEKLLGARDAGRWSNMYISPLQDGVFGRVQSVIQQPNINEIPNVLYEAKQAVSLVQQAWFVVPMDATMTATDQTILENEKTAIASALTSASRARTAIATQQSINATAVATAESNLESAKNAMAIAQNDLELKKAGTRPEQIDYQKSRVASAEANVRYYQAQLGKTIIRSPINGLVSKQIAKVGEMLTSGTPVVSVMSENQFEIEARIPEVDIAKIHVGAVAFLTLDAYGSDKKFAATVISIDPAEEIIDGIATYKTTLQFIGEDERVKSGLTADIDILGATKENVLAIPQRALVKKDDALFARILKEKTVEEIPVQTGFRSTDGLIEIITGLTAGDKVITFMED